MVERPALNRARVVRAAVAVADRRGLAGVSMRSVGRELGVEAMSLYHHVSGKEALLDAMVDWIFVRIELPGTGQPWRQAMEDRCASARAVLARHPWALGLMESRTSPGPALLHHHDAVLGCLRANGFPVRLAAHAYSALDSYVYGFVLTELHLPFAPGEGAEEFTAELAPPPDRYPHLAEFITEMVVGREYAYGDEFSYGLALVLDQLEQRLADQRP
ncbi:TetR/AcrR family transcriptional regulator [Nocardiopsis metallicus]|uniref:AcrR family transcriptional regulator n=1 Tax=Nocardiopsis metallicus TaxID=179819 RepID=A0A840WH61_9ACTN|nr:TetR/AcrR family transcriptional regulator [Nocardiopsis metallicus]MBB5489408.1 AcrR family transcriptional regulator [Nocardiopsis metallicus]